MPNQRQQLDPLDFAMALQEVEEKLQFRVQQKGLGTLASSHEILGILDEEYTEFRDEVHANSGEDKKVEELKDIAVAAIFGIASYRAGGTDW